MQRLLVVLVRHLRRLVVVLVDPVLVRRLVQHQPPTAVLVRPVLVLMLVLIHPGPAGH